MLVALLRFTAGDKLILESIHEFTLQLKQIHLYHTNFVSFDNKHVQVPNWQLSQVSPSLDDPPLPFLTP